uniref:Uncharacterized protein n=1 Tax=Vespula pensylvanica TaxID=30213 RepID=A0A834P147_VESPE|nr:hypothetical protein H0235_008760 [Vespula pensylvanica]
MRPDYVTISRRPYVKLSIKDDNDDDDDDDDTSRDMEFHDQPNILRNLSLSIFEEGQDVSMFENHLRPTAWHGP